MAITKEIIIKADTSEAVTNVEGLGDGIKEVGDSAVSTSKDISGMKKASDTASKGIRGIGTAFKALGIGIVVALFAKLAEILSRNQKVVDLLSNVMKTLEIAFKDLYGFITQNFMPAFEQLKTFFENLTFEQIGEAIKNNIIERFNSVLDVIGFVGTAFKELFAGNFDAALDAIGDAGKEMVDVFTGVDGTVDKVSETLTKGASSLANYAKESYNAASGITEVAKQALIAEAINQGLIEKYDRQAEQQRQIRDDESRSIEDRIAANIKLGEILEEQEKTMLENAEISITAAENAKELNDRTETQIALIQAKNEKMAIQAQVEGFRSEQLINTNSLLKEQIELEKQAGTEQEGVDQEAINKKLREFREFSELEKIEDERNFALAELSRLESSEEEKQLVKDFYDKKRRSQKQKEADDEKRLDENVANAKINIAGNTSALISKLVEQDSALGKGVAVAQATISGFQGVQNAFTTASDSPITKVFPAYPFIQAGLAGAFSAIQIKNILKTNPKTGAGGGGQSSGGGGGGAAAPAPSFNLVEGTGTNQISDSLSRQDNPIKAFVVSSDVSNAQSLDRNIVQNSSL